MIRPVTASDASDICELYNYYVLNTHVNFEEEAVTVEDMLGRIGGANQNHPWLVYEHEGKVIGYAYASAWKSRCSYRYSVETSVYIAHEHKGKGLGSLLYDVLLKQLKQTNAHAIIGGIALPNEGSVALHEKFGFEKIAQFKEVGFKLNKWIDVGYWEIINTN